MANMATADLAFEPLLTIEQLARVIGRSHWTLRRDAKAGRIRFVRIGNALMIEPAEVRRIKAEGLASVSGPSPALAGR